MLLVTSCSITQGLLSFHPMSARVCYIQGCGALCQRWLCLHCYDACKLSVLARRREAEQLHLLAMQGKGSGRGVNKKPATKGNVKTLNKTSKAMKVMKVKKGIVKTLDKKSKATKVKKGMKVKKAAMKFQKVTAVKFQKAAMKVRKHP